jgi:hypothetical protein
MVTSELTEATEPHLLGLARGSLMGMAHLTSAVWFSLYELVSIPPGNAWKTQQS